MSLGLICSKLFLMLAEQILQEIVLNFYWPTKAMLFTLVIMGGAFLLISLLAPLFTRKNKLIDMMNKTMHEEKLNMKIVLPIFTISFALSIWFDRLLSDLIYVTGFIAFITFIYLLAYCIYRCYLAYLKWSGKNMKGLHLLKRTNFQYRIANYLQTITISTLFFTIVLTAFVFIVGAPSSVEDYINKIIPYAYMFDVWDDEVDEVAMINALREEIKDQAGFQEMRVDHIDMDTDNFREIIVPQSMYNDLTAITSYAPIQLNDNEYYVIPSKTVQEPQMTGKQAELFNRFNLNSHRDNAEGSIALAGYFTSATVVSDDTYVIIKNELGLPTKSFYVFVLDH